MSVSVGADVTRAVQTISKVATITFVAKTAGPTQIQFDSTKSRVFSLKPADKPTENVLLSGLAPANVTVNTSTCTGGGGVSGTPAPSGIPGLPGVSTTPGVGGGLSGTPAPSGLAPVCSEFNVAPANAGPAPYSVAFTAKGNSPVTTGLITTTTFTFGDGQTQAVTDGMNLKDVTAQVNHTYQAAGNYTATVVFTDNTGAQSAACNQVINTTASASASPTVEAEPTTEAPLVEKPTIEPTGSVAQTFGIIGAVILTIVGGFIFLAL